MESSRCVRLSMCWNRSCVSHNSWLLTGGFPIIDTIHWIVFMVAGFCVLFLLFSYMDKQKEKITGKTSAGKSEKSEEE